MESYLAYAPNHLFFSKQQRYHHHHHHSLSHHHDQFGRSFSVHMKQLHGHFHLVFLGCFSKSPLLTNLNLSVQFFLSFEQSLINKTLSATGNV